jgi:hypothetical protein
MSTEQAHRRLLLEKKRGVEDLDSLSHSFGRINRDVERHHHEDKIKRSSAILQSCTPYVYQTNRDSNGSIRASAPKHNFPSTDRVPVAIKYLCTFFSGIMIDDRRNSGIYAGLYHQSELSMSFQERKVEKSKVL